VEQLIEICNYVKHYHTVYGNWGFNRKLSLGKGLNVLFAGPSGTGKTMAGEIMANELGLDLYKIDLSAIVSKYVGETEKNLDRIFREGQTSNAILFFDEADALFGKRSEVRDSHDRYANIEVAYLLQKMEEYEGVVILATNLRKNMDEAFARRMHFTLEFPIPEENDRYRIWQGIFPGEAPLAKDIDLSFLARQFKITGGNIKNIALSAAFLTAEDGGLITMENLIRATKREYQKIGKLCTEADFAHYFDLVKG
jgi:SpoVK/Ycf46/Vps4 family AAA+-type ATPase